MVSKTTFRDPVFVRDDDTTTIRASVIEWGGGLDGFSIKFSDGNEGVLISAEDWPAIKSCIDNELARAGAA